MRIRSLVFVSGSLLLSGALAVAVQAGISSAQNAVLASADSCERVARLELPNAKITMAKAVPAGTFEGPPEVFSGPDLSAFYKMLPGFCRVVAHATPTADSDIPIEVWMPLAGWNGKLEGLGNGGFAGAIGYDGLGAAIAQRLCGRRHRYRPRRLARRRILGARTSGESRRLRPSRHPRDDPGRQARCSAVLRIGSRSAPTSLGAPTAAAKR